MELGSELFLQILIILIDLVLGLLIAFRLSKGKSKKRNIILGMATILVIAPLLSVLFAWLLSLIFQSITNDPLILIGFLFIFSPFFFFVGLGFLLIGIFRKNNG